MKGLPEGLLSTNRIIENDATWQSFTWNAVSVFSKWRALRHNVTRSMPTMIPKPTNTSMPNLTLKSKITRLMVSQQISMSQFILVSLDHPSLIVLDASREKNWRHHFLGNRKIKVEFKQRHRLPSRKPCESPEISPNWLSKFNSKRAIIWELTTKRKITAQGITNTDGRT